MSGTRKALAVASVLLGAACGLSAVGEMLAPGDRDGGAEDAGRPVSPDGSNGGDGDVPTGDAAGDADAGGVDAQPLCLAVCEAGTCSGGTCFIDCVDASTCNSRVVCPPGVACDVKCASGNCSQGIDCTAARACVLDCAGPGSCNGQRLACSGSACSVNCGATSCAQGIACDGGSCNIGCGAGSCNSQTVVCETPGACVVACAGDNSCAQSVRCDGGSCNIRCAGQNTCNGQRVECNAATTCGVQCGADAGGGAGKESCMQSVSCTAAAACNITCTAADTCKNQRVLARAAAVDVKCLETNTCSSGVTVSGNDAGITCDRNGCGPSIQCDAGRCFAHCAGTGNPDTDLCCPAGSVCGVDASSCDETLFKLGCP